jgi:hypothetical protein
MKLGAWGRGRLPVDGKFDNFQLQNHPKKKSPMPFSRHGTFFNQFPALPLTLLFIGGQIFQTILAIVSQQ